MDPAPTTVAPANRAPAIAPTGSRWSNGLLITWVALIAADRIDMFGHAGGVFVPPFFVLTPLVVGAELWRRRRWRRPVTLPGRAITLLVLVLVLLSFVGASVLVSQETAVSASRAFLLAAYVGGAFAVVLVAVDRDDLMLLFARGAALGILLYTLFDVAEVAALIGRLPESLQVGPTSILLMPSTYGAFVPRLSGMVTDQNRSGFILLFFGWFVGFRPDRGARRGYLALVALLIALTLSRSGAVAALAALAMLLLERRLRWVPRRTLLVAGLLASTLTFVLLVSEPAREVAADVVAPLVQRVSVDEGSSQVHLTLIGRGIDEGTASLPRLALGLGYGSAYTVLDDLFPGDRYGNFHSLYVTIFAETGVVALVCLLVILVVPLVASGPFRALILGAVLFNVFYQTINEPAFWTTIALAWSSLPSVARRSREAEWRAVA
jgi:O-antigen ligase